MHKLESTLSRIFQISFVTFKVTVHPKNVWTNQVPFTNNKINKGIIRRNQLINKSKNFKTNVERIICNKQSNYSVSMIWKKRPVLVTLAYPTEGAKTAFVKTKNLFFRIIQLVNKNHISRKKEDFK